MSIKATKELLERLDDYRFAHGKRSRSEAALELLDRALKVFFEVSPPEPVRPGDPDYALARGRRRQPSQAFRVREIEVRLARLKRC